MKLTSNLFHQDFGLQLEEIKATWDEIIKNSAVTWEIERQLTICETF